ncbi:MAG: DUF1887 family CARF protein [Marinilabiliales bacterium]
MANIIVSIVSDQTLPNYLFIKEHSGKIDKYIFISTKAMEENKKTKIICDTAGIDKKQRNKILVEEDALYQIKEKLNKLSLKPDDNYLINLTGGTKLMSIAVKEYFKKFENTSYFYIPIGKNTYKQIYDDKKAVESDFNYQITVKEYLSIYGIEFEEQQICFTEHQVFDVFNEVKVRYYDLGKFPKSKLKKFNIQGTKQTHTKWFEEYIYYKIKNSLNLKEDAIKTGIKLFDVNKNNGTDNKNNDNELDIFFIYKNNPYLVETKFSVGKGKINSSNLNVYLYKLAAVNKRFGLKAKAIIMTLGQLNTNSDSVVENLKHRCKILNINFPFFRNDIVDDVIFKEKLINFIN